MRKLESLVIVRQHVRVLIYVAGYTYACIVDSMNNATRTDREWDGEAWVEAAEAAIRTRDLRIEALEDCLRKASDALRKSSERIDELNAELARVSR